MNMDFQGIKMMPITELGVSQIYLNKKKLKKIDKWFKPDDIEKYPPFPVHDFGDGKYTLTDGHSRAFAAYKAGVKSIPVIYDTDDIVASDLGLLQYRNNIEWCKRFNVFSIADLEDRIISDMKYKKLWIKRCDRSYNLLTQISEETRKNLKRKQKGLFLYGASDDMKTLYFENNQGKVFKIRNF